MALSAISNTFNNLFPKIPKKLTQADDDFTTFIITQPKRLAWFSTPVADKDASHNHQAHHEDDSASIASSIRTAKHEKHAVDGEPVLKRAHESSVIQLFYDLFFVANLTTFTGVHEVNDATSKKIPYLRTPY
jgi:hypothetical protein